MFAILYLIYLFADFESPFLCRFRHRLGMSRSNLAETVCDVIFCVAVQRFNLTLNNYSWSACVC